MLATIEAACGIIWQGATFLANRRPPGKPFSGYWELPGGKLEKGESPSQALLRELQEELAITASKYEYWRTFESPYPANAILVILHVFQIHKFQGQPQGMENQELLWIKTNEWKNFDFLPADIKILECLANRNQPNLENPDQMSS